MAITNEQFNQLAALLAAGNRGEFYWQYYLTTG